MTAPRPTYLAHLLHHHSRILALCSCLVSLSSQAQVTTPLVVNTGTTSDITSNTSYVITGGQPAATVNGTLNLDGTAILFTSTQGHAIQVNSGGVVNVPQGATIGTGWNTTTTTNGPGSGLVVFTGGTADATNLTIDNRGTGTSGGSGAIASGGSITLRGSDASIMTSTSSAVALGAELNGQLTVTAPLGITQSGTGSTGIYLHDSGHIVLPNNLSLSLTGRSSTGIVVDNSTLDTTTQGTNLVIDLSGTTGTGSNGGVGVLVANGGSATLNGLTVGGANASAGVVAISGNSSLFGTANDNSVNVELTNAQIDVGATSPTYRVLSSNALVTTNPVIATQYENQFSSTSTGLRAYSPRATADATNTITATNSTIRVSAANADGLMLGSSTLSGLNTISLINSSVEMSAGTYAGGVLYNNSFLVATGSSITTTDAVVGLIIHPTSTGSASVDLTNTDILAQGTWTMGSSSGLPQGINIVNSATQGVIPVSLNGGSLIADGVAIYAYGATDVTFSNGAVVTGRPTPSRDGILVVAGITSNDTLINMQALSGSTLSGDAIVNSPTVPEGVPLFDGDGVAVVINPTAAAPTLNMTLAGGSTWNGAAYDVTNLSLADAASIWNMTASSTVTQQVTNAGLIAFSAPSGNTYKTLTTTNYVGNGGTLRLNTFLGDDSAPSDKLVIQGGSATGRSGLDIRNTTGAGDITSGNGILVVEAHSSTTTDAFALTGPVLAGPYEYTLHRASLDTSGPENWYLRSTIDCAAPGAPTPPCPEPDPDPPGPPVPPVPPNPTPNYRDEVSLYTAIAPLALLYSRAVLDTLHERVGEETHLRGRSELQDDNGPNGSWMRIIALDGERDGARHGIYGDGPNYNYDFLGLQIGLDLYNRQHSNDHRDIAGAYFAAGVGNAEPDHFNGNAAGSDHLSGTSLAGYWTHFGPSDWYLDGILQATYYRISAEPDRDLPSMKTNGWGIASSLEGGYPFQLSGQWVIEPQAQLVYQWIDLDDSHDLAADVRFEEVESLASRLGVRVAKTWSDNTAPQRMFTAWGRLSAWYEALGEPETRFSSNSGYIPFQSDLSGGWSEAKLGVTGELRRNLFLYGSVGYEQSFDGDREQWDGKIGMRSHF